MTTSQTKQTVTQFNLQTGEVIEVEMTDEEISIIKAQNAEIKKQRAEADAKVAARESALGKLAALGLTADEIGAL